MRLCAGSEAPVMTAPAAGALRMSVPGCAQGKAGAQPGMGPQLPGKRMARRASVCVIPGRLCEPIEYLAEGRHLPFQRQRWVGSSPQATGAVAH